MKRLYIFIAFCILLTGCMSHEVKTASPTIVEKSAGASTNVSVDTASTPEKVSIPAPPVVLTSPQKDNAGVPELAGGKESLVRTTEKHNDSVSKAVYYFGSRTSQEVALTFDDGPDVYFTTKILDELKKQDVKATFFIVGVRAKAHPEMVKRIADEGHAIGNHTWDHPYLSRKSDQQVFNELDSADKLLNKIVGYHPALFRPPYGAASSKVIKKVTSMGYSIIDWSVDTRDWAGTSPAQMMTYVKKEMYPGGIILQHCAGGTKEDLSNTIKLLPEVISSLKDKGYKFVTIPELLGIPSVRK